MTTIRAAVFLCATSLLAACGSSSGGAGGGAGGGTGGGVGGGSGGGSSTTQPLVTSTNPPDNSLGVAINVRLAATFNIAMDPTTLTATTFTLKQGTTAVTGAVAYAGSTATFVPSAALSASLVYTATLSTGAKGANGIAMAAAKSWTFTTGTTAAVGPAPVLLGTAGDFVVLAKTAISTVPASSITGNIGISPAAGSFATGFSETADASNVFSTSTQLIGKLYAADFAVPTPMNLTTAVSNMETAYVDAAGRSNPDFLEKGTGNIGGLTLAPGLYKWTSTVTIPADVTLSGGANDVWIFQTSGDVTMTAAKNVILTGGAQAKNVFWQVAGKVTVGATAHFEGIILSKTEITLETSSTMKGRALAQTLVALQKATLTQP